MVRHGRTSIASAAAIALVGCTSQPADNVRVTGSDAAVAGLPRFAAPGRFVIPHCCSLRVSPGIVPQPEQGIDSAIYTVRGTGYRLRIVFGAHDGGTPSPGYILIGKRLSDGVAIAGFRWISRGAAPEGDRLWLAAVGGGVIAGVRHTPWTLRIMVDCATPTGCAEATAVVDTIRF